MHPIWFSLVGFPGSFTHCSTTLHDMVYSAFHCSSSAVGCFWKDGLWGGLRSLSPIFLSPTPPPGFHICSPICAWKRQREVLFWAKGPLTAEVSRKPKNTCEVTACCFCLCLPVSSIAHLQFFFPTASLSQLLLICWPCKCSRLDLNPAVIKRLQTRSCGTTGILSGLKIILHCGLFRWISDKSCLSGT